MFASKLQAQPIDLAARTDNLGPLALAASNSSTIQDGTPPVAARSWSEQGIVMSGQIE
ncbi:MAG TPA: hypothetical protein VIN77_15020 [Aurantimonas sp.]|uniref:Uncharacterized protein n=1 Tax=Aurantimonas marianensis TaxID=2920428 RepID=A0A9X2HBS1_9HYPH|nr:hypothetical protein [Aurantimonas marianensis]MCP3056823.1 hypothetical protein [Aurantimonas marianensis]